MAPPRARISIARPIPSEFEGEFADSVRRICTIISLESKRLEQKLRYRGLTVKDSRLLLDMAWACKSLHSGTLHGAEAILAKRKAVTEK